MNILEFKKKIFIFIQFWFILTKLAIIKFESGITSLVFYTFPFLLKKFIFLHYTN